MYPAQSEIKFFYDLFRKESTKAHESLEFMSRVVLKMKGSLNDTSPDNEYVNVLKIIRSFSSVINNFNFEYEIAIASFDEQMKNATKFVDENENYPMLMRPSRVPLVDLSYKIGDRSKCIISYIQDIEKDLCFIVDIQCLISSDFQEHIVDNMNGIPNEGIVFGTYLNHKILRATRTHSLPTLMGYKAVLIDIGEVISISTTTSTYKLDSYSLSIPPRAILCFVEQVNGKPEQCLKRIIGRKSFDFRVTKVCSNMLHIELNDDKKDNIVESIQPKVVFKNEVSNKWETPGYSLEIRSPQTIPSIGKCSVSENLPKLPPRPSSAINEISQTLSSSLTIGKSTQTSDDIQNETHIDSIQCPQFMTVNSLTSPQESSFPSPTTTDNIHLEAKDEFDSPKAPTTSTPSPERNISTPKNPFRSPLFSKRRQEKLQKSESIDLSPISNAIETANIDSHSEYNNPTPTELESYKPCGITEPSNDIVNALCGNCKMFGKCAGVYSKIDSIKNLSTTDQTYVYPTVVYNLGEFYVQLQSQMRDINDLQMKLNDPNVKLKNIQQVRLHQMVLARYANDDQIYRAKIIRRVKPTAVKVFYLDYGNIEMVRLDNIYEWNEICSILPYQAIRCSLADVNSHIQYDLDEIKMFREKVCNRCVAIKIIERHGDQLLIRLIE